MSEVKEDITKLSTEELERRMEEWCDKKLPFLRKHAEAAKLQYEADLYIHQRKVLAIKVAEFETSQREGAKESHDSTKQ